MRPRFVYAVALTELKRLFKSRYYYIPLTILSGLLFIVIPGMMLLMATRSSPSPLVRQISASIDYLPRTIQENIRGDTPGSQMAYGLAVYLLAPIAVVVPMTISSAVGANTIVGERERGTGEFLAHSPLTVEEIYLGKLLSSLVPGLATNIVGFAIYSLMVNVIVGPHVGEWFFPTTGWWLLIFWVVPPFLLIALSLIVRLSARMSTAAAAHQAATLVTVPVIFLSGTVTFGLLYESTVAGLILGSLAWAAAFVSARAGARALKREDLLGFGTEE